MMTVGQLVGILKDMPQDAEVTVSERPLNETLKFGHYHDTKDHETLNVELADFLRDGRLVVFIMLASML